MTESLGNSEIRICVIIPTYDNVKTIAKVISETLEYCKDVYVVNDGSTDETLNILKEIKAINLISYDENKGKGYAIRKGFEAALSHGFDYAITIDSDGQHYPDDIEVLLKKHKSHPKSLLVGSRNIKADGMPKKNSFANKFSNFWYWVETGEKLPDTQSGLRLYPIYKYKKTRWFGTKYEFEVEVLVRSNWSGIIVLAVPVKVYYPPENERVSHFKPLKDFTRISILNTFLVLITYLYIMPIKLYKYLANNRFTSIIKEQIMMHNENPFKISLAMGFGIFMSFTPIWGFQMLIAALLAHALRLNKVLVVLFSNISIPPVIPFIIYFSYKTGGIFFHNSIEFNMDTLIYLKEEILDGHFYKTLNEFGYSILQYVTGSLVLGIIAGLTVGIVTYMLITISKLKKNKVIS